MRYVFHVYGVKESELSQKALGLLMVHDSAICFNDVRTPENKEFLMNYLGSKGYDITTIDIPVILYGDDPELSTLVGGFESLEEFLLAGEVDSEVERN